MKNEGKVINNFMGMSKIYTMTECAIFAALLCIFSPITIPIGPIPVSMGIFAVMLTGIILGWKKGVLSVLVYLLIGLCGVPLFSGGKSGLAAFLGPTGGYIWSYIIMVMVIGFLSQKDYRNKLLSFLVPFAATILGVILCYVFGTIQFMYVADYSLAEALAVCVYPFIPLDLLKALCAVLLGISVRRGLKKAGFLK